MQLFSRYLNSLTSSFQVCPTVIITSSSWLLFIFSPFFDSGIEWFYHFFWQSLQIQYCLCFLGDSGTIRWSKCRFLHMFSFRNVFLRWYVWMLSYFLVVVFISLSTVIMYIRLSVWLSIYLRIILWEYKNCGMYFIIGNTPVLYRLILEVLYYKVMCSVESSFLSSVFCGIFSNPTLNILLFFWIVFHK